MKRKTIRIKPKAATFNGGPVTACRNLVPRVESGRGFLGVAPETVHVADGLCRPLATRYRADASAMTLWSRTPPGGVEGLWTNDPANPSEFTLVRDNIRAFCAIATASGFIVMTDSGPLTLSEQEDDGSLAVDAPASDLAPMISLEAVPAGELSASLPAMTMKDVDFSRTSPQLRSRDVKDLGTNLADAYRLLAATAADGALWIQPVVARYHLLSASGQRVFSSSPLVMTAGGWQCTGEFSAGCTKNGSQLSVPAFNISAQAYRLTLRIDEASLRQLAEAGVESIEIDCTPQIHVVDPAATPSWRLTRQSTDSPLLTVALPGASDHFCSREAVFAGRLTRAAAAIGSLEQRVAVVHSPFSSGTTAITRTASVDFDTETRLIEKAAKSVEPVYVPPAGTASLLSEICTPHSFTAATVAVSGNTVAWADITPLPCRAVNVAQLCGDWIGEPCSGAVRMTCRDGTVSVAPFSLPRRPQAWASVVSVPDVAATRIEIFVRNTSGSVAYGSAELSPMPDGRHAAMIAPSLVGEKFRPWTGTVPAAIASRTVGRRRPGAIVTADISQPVTPLSAIECCHSPVRALMPAIRPQSSWDFSRCHLYAFSEAAVHAVSLSTRQRLATAAIIVPEGIESQQAATRTDEAAIALSQGRFISIKASRAVASDFVDGFRQAAWDAATQKLWLTDRFGNLTAADASLSAFSDISAPVDFENIYSEAARIWLADSDALYRLTDPDAPRRVLWESDIPVQARSRPTAIEIRLSARQLRGTVTLRGSRISGDDASAILLSLRIDGAVDAPLIYRLAAPAYPWLRLTLDAEVSPDFHFDDIILNLLCHE